MEKVVREMSAYSHVALIDGYVDSIADIICGEQLMNLKEVGVFLDAAPTAEARTVEAAIRFDGSHLGIASWSLTPLYVEGKFRLLGDKTNIRVASAILLVAPEYTSAWNVRKSHLKPDQVSAELQFSKMVLLRSPKSAETWSHRSWVLNRFGCSFDQMVEELDITSTTASRVPHNYYAGVHRLKITAQAPRSILLSELGSSRKWLRSHVSDSSGWWYHRRLVEKLECTEPSAFDAEITFCSELVERYREQYQSINIHWRWLMVLQTSPHIGQPVTKHPPFIGFPQHRKPEG